MKEILGGKGAGLAEMTNIGIPVPAGFTISTEVCEYFYKNNKKYPQNLKKQIEDNLSKLEKTTGKKFGDKNNPLLLSVRSGASISMPGMMDTILNLGINDDTIKGLLKKTKNEYFSYDTYRRFIQMFGNVVKNIPIEEFEDIMKKIKANYKIKLDKDLQKKHIEEIISEYKKLYKKFTKQEFPQDVKEQLNMAIDAVFLSWNNERAIKYREINEIKDIKGTAVNIQSMVFGNYGDNSGTGVCFSRDPSTGEKKIYGEYLINAQGEDVVAGIRTPMKIDELKKQNKKIYNELEKAINKLEKHYKDIQDIEFTVCDNELFLLQTRTGKRTGLSAIKSAIDMVNEKLITKEEAIIRVEPKHIEQLLCKTIEKEEKSKATLVAKGLNASFGAGCGEIVFSAEEAEKQVKKGKKVILVRQNTSPEDISGMVVSEAILTGTGGMTSHAAIVSRGLGTPCVICAGQVEFFYENKKKYVKINGKNFVEGDCLTIDGTTGEVFEGKLKLNDGKFNKDTEKFLSWCDDICEKTLRKNGKTAVKGFDVFTNADQPKDVKTAYEFGAKGIGLCRTEHMFFDKEKLTPFRAMICSDTIEMRKKYLSKIMPYQQKDFLEMFKILNGKSVIIRLLDPPLHEFLPKNKQDFEKLANYMKISVEELERKSSLIKEINPMMGHRGCRLALTYPEIYEMQVEAIINAVVECEKKNIKTNVKIMIPIVCDENELSFVRNICENKIKEVLTKFKDKKNQHFNKIEKIINSIQIGTMIETPRSALLAEKIAKYADFFSFGTNDLTQTTFAFSRDDINKIMNVYFEKNIFALHPFKTIDTEGVGQLIKIATINGRKTKNNLHIGICGEHGGEEKSIEFCYKNNLNYVSCSPFRVPIARLCCAKAVIKAKSK